MNIKTITTDELRAMHDREGLILQGCGGDPQEWLNGINDLFTQAGILLENTKFQEISVFQHEGMTCLLYPMDDSVNLHISKLAAWRLTSHDTFGGTWLSDYVENRLGGFARDQPAVEPEESPGMTMGWG